MTMLGMVISPQPFSPLSPQHPANSGLKSAYLKDSLNACTPPPSLSLPGPTEPDQSHDPLRAARDVCSTIPGEYIKKIQQVVTHFLHRCNSSFDVTPYDYQFHNTCVEEAVRRGYPLDTPNAQGHTLRAFLPQGIVMSMTTYAHLRNESTQIYIAFYTALLIYLDHIFEDELEMTIGFNKRFIQRQPQGDLVLDMLADLLRETPQHFGLIVSNIIVTTTMSLINALLLEHQSLDSNLSLYAREFPQYIRIMSGAGEAFTLFAFPREAPLHCYMHGIPDMRAFFNNGNDVLSFYKEEVGGESVNQISTLARCQQVPKIDILRRIADSVADSHARVLKIFAPQPAALETYLHFSNGYIRFHTSLERYRLGELLDYCRLPSVPPNQS